MAEDFKNLINKEDLDEYHKGAKKVFASGEHQHAELTIHDAVGGDKVYDGTQPVEIKALKGEDGFAPTIEVSEEDGKHTLTIKDKNGTQTVEILDGAGGGIGDVGQYISNVKSTGVVDSRFYKMPNTIDGISNWINKPSGITNGTGFLYCPNKQASYEIKKSDGSVENRTLSDKIGGLDYKGAGGCAADDLDDVCVHFFDYMGYPDNTYVADKGTVLSGTSTRYKFGIKQYGFKSTDTDKGKLLKIYKPVIANLSATGWATLETLEFDVLSEDYVKQLIAENAGGGGGSSAVELLDAPMKLSDLYSSGVNITDYLGDAFNAASAGIGASESSNLEIEVTGTIGSSYPTTATWRFLFPKKGDPLWEATSLSGDERWSLMNLYSCAYAMTGEDNMTGVHLTAEFEHRANASDALLKFDGSSADYSIKNENIIIHSVKLIQHP